MTEALTYGEYGGRYVPETLVPALDELGRAWEEAQADEAFADELLELWQRYIGRPKVSRRHPYVADATLDIKLAPRWEHCIRKVSDERANAFRPAGAVSRHRPAMRSRERCAVAGASIRGAAAG